MTSRRSGSDPHWRAGLTLVFTAIIVIATLFAPVLLAAIQLFADTGGLLLSGLRDALTEVVKGQNFLALNVLVSMIISCFLLFTVIKLKAGASVRRYLAIRPISLRQLLLWVAAILLVSVAFDFLIQLLGIDRIPQSMFDMWNKSGSLWLLALAVVIAAPVWEELLFRGFLMRGLASSVVGGAGAVVIAALIWTLMHVQYEWYYLTVLFCLGLLLGAARLVTGSVLVPIAMHIAQNLLALAQIAFYQNAQL